MAKVLVEHFSLQSLGIVDFDSAVDPFDDLGVIICQHFGQLIEKLSDRVMLVRSIHCCCLGEILLHESVHAVVTSSSDGC